MLSRIIYQTGVRLRNPSLNNSYLLLKEAENWSLEQSGDYQLDKCRELLQFADSYSTFWSQYFKDCNFSVKDFKSLEDLKKIPPITKKHLLKNNAQIHTSYNFKKLFFSETSGTTGEVLEFFKNEEWDSFNRAAIMRGYSWYNVKPWERNGYFWGYNLSGSQVYIIRILDALQNRFRLFSYNKKEIIKFAKKLKRACYLHGYSSMIYEVAKICNDLELSIDNLKMVKGTSEKIYESYQKEIIKAFGVKAINEYGAAETGIIAFECPRGNMHVNMQGVIVEEEHSEIIVTNLMSKSFPIIRYKLGDYVELDNSTKCSCGMDTPLIKSILGRVGKSVYGFKNIYPSLTFYYIFKNLALNHSINLNYQVIQKEKGKLEFKIEQSLTNSGRKRLELEIVKYFKNDIYYEISEKQMLHKMKGKMKDFISYIE